MRAFYAHARDGARVKDRVALRTLLAGKGLEAHVVLGINDHIKNWKGNWEEWQKDVVHRVNFVTKKPVYDLFITGGDTCGRATAGILREALSAGKPVFWWDGNGKLERVTGVVTFDPEDWQHGWRFERSEK